MFKKISVFSVIGVVGLWMLFFIANRPISQLIGYFRASASTTVKSLEEEIPDVIHDEKTETELAAARQQLVDRQVQLNLSQNQLQGLKNEISELTKSINGRKQVLASAYPVLETALTGGQPEVMFVSTRFSMTDFQHEIDDLLAMQERDEHALKIKQQGHERLAGSVAEGEAALTEMKHRLLEIEQDFAVLKTRRDQARMESETLDLVAGATADRSNAAADISNSVQRLEGQVEHLEARNAARRDVAPIDQRASEGKLTQSFNRLEALKKYATSDDDNSNSKDGVAASENPEDNTSSDIVAREVVIRVKSETPDEEPN